MLRNLLLVGAGGFAGSIARYLLSLFINRQVSGTAFPWGTLAVNAVGCFGIGLLAGLAERQQWMGGALWLLLATGFCGGFTTFSALSLENLKLVREQLPFMALFYTVLSITVGYIACWGGWKLAI